VARRTGKDVFQPVDADAIRLAKTLIRSARYGALATVHPAEGAPLATRVAVASDLDGAPIILVSALSAHTGALIAEPRCSLLLGEPGKGDPLAHPRISLACRALHVGREHPDRERLSRRYLNRHPKARFYAGFSDFSFFRLQPAGASLNGGFARAYALVPEDILSDAAVAAELAGAEQGALDHMNADHAEAVAAYARHFAKARDGDWRMTGIDPDGFDLALGDATCRTFFREPLREAAELRPALVAMAREARAGVTEAGAL
jgi:putative heme iron utilization protein